MSKLVLVLRSFYIYVLCLNKSLIILLNTTGWLLPNLYGNKLAVELPAIARCRKGSAEVGVAELMDIIAVWLVDIVFFSLFSAGLWYAL
jgi:hypothetical protein